MKVCVYIGRFQPFHEGHLTVLRTALANYDRTIVVLGSAQEDRDLDKNPFDTYERTLMIAGSLTPSEIEKVRITRQYDCPDENDRWVESVKGNIERFARAWEKQAGENVEIFLTGSRKDESSFYIDLLPWTFVPAPPHNMIHATDIRTEFFRCTAAIRADGNWFPKYITSATRQVMYAHALNKQAESLLRNVEEKLPIDPFELRFP